MATHPSTRTLLCELHAHSTWSDGDLGLRELVDRYGTAGFDVLCVTDHVLRSDDPWRSPLTCVHEATFAGYLSEIDREAERMLRAQGTEDHKEAVRAFVEKRKPNFRGK